MSNKKKLIVGNWKMNGSLAANEALLKALIAAGKVRPVIHSFFAAADAAQAHAFMESNQHIGKIVLTW